MVGEIAVTSGPGVMYVNTPARLGGDVPAGVVTVMSTAMPVPAGLVAVIWVSLSTVKALAGVLSKVTPVAPVNPVPVMVMVSPPASDLLVGATPVTCGPAGV